MNPLTKIKLLLTFIITTFVLEINISLTQAQNIKICSVSDIHYFNPQLIEKNGKAFQKSILYDRKMVAESDAIFKSFCDTIQNIKPDILLITGDLTKDGELLCHTVVASELRKLMNKGIKVFVVPGNHDINNHNALSYNGDSTKHVQFIVPEEFEKIYADFGYKQALDKDPYSRSYVAEPVNGLQILAIDACRYEISASKPHPETSGGIRPETYKWLKSKIANATAQNKIIIGIMHHGMLEHFKGQKTIFPKYVIDAWDTISSQLADLGLQIVFTGHFHAQDIVKKQTSAGNNIYDIETGSLLTYPCPYRIITLTTDRKFIVSGRRITGINYNTGNLTFQEYAKNELKKRMPSMEIGFLTSPSWGINLSTDQAKQIEPFVSMTMMAHYEGDEKNPSPEILSIIKKLKEDNKTNTLGNTLEAIWNDPQPSDWNTTIDLGAFYKNKKK
ncbi:MAG: metallophosphoesterase [Bacteroidota bacterium]|nr:metallophosphoesterase [Bacteroidota bacterium]